LGALVVTVSVLAESGEALDVLSSSAPFFGESEGGTEEAGSVLDFVPLGDFLGSLVMTLAPSWVSTKALSLLVLFLLLGLGMGLIVFSVSSFSEAGSVRMSLQDALEESNCFSALDSDPNLRSSKAEENSERSEALSLASRGKTKDSRSCGVRIARTRPVNLKGFRRRERC